MPNVNVPKGTRYSGWFKDDLNTRLEIYHQGVFIGYVATAGATGMGRTVAKIGSNAAIASDGANSVLDGINFVAPASLKIVSAWRLNHSASDVTKGTATTSASYRRLTLITNTAGAGSGTNIVASSNATASAASKVTRSFTTIASTVPTGAVVLCSSITVGAATADGTDMAASDVFIAYELV